MPISDGLIAPDKRTNREIEKKTHTFTHTVTATAIHNIRALKSYLQKKQNTTKNKV